MYAGYLECLSKIDVLSFKRNNKYRGILEHVSHELGKKYLQLIDLEYTTITYDKLYGFLTLNDKIGDPEKRLFTFKGKAIFCSPSSLRYVYQALVILDHYRQTSCKNIVEVGCGYGGLCLAINYFSTPSEISTYNIVDLPEACNLIRQYLDLHKESIKAKIVYHDSETYGSNITDPSLFFISNYCYTEIETVHNSGYTTTLLPKCDNGFILWQNGGNRGSYPITDASHISGKKITYSEEKPQTDSGEGIHKNYFAFF
jgi:hypothetical protein